MHEWTTCHERNATAKCGYNMYVANVMEIAGDLES